LIDCQTQFAASGVKVQEHAPVSIWFWSWESATNVIV